jgi:hypothetical protein
MAAPTPPWPYLTVPLQPPIADANTRDLCHWVFSNWRDWRRPDGDDERVLNTDELIVIRAAVERLAWCGTRVH